MEVTTLLENDSLNSVYKNRSGLSLYIETQKHKILFDLGPNDRFIKNAEFYGIDIKEVDTVIISHGHKDHGGGIKAFLEANTKAKIYINKNAFKGFYANFIKIFKVYVGLDKSIKENERIILVEDYLKIDEELILFSEINEKEYTLEFNRGLFIKSNQGFILDDFNHEQNLIIKEGNKNNLFIGCGHNGIINITKKAEDVIEDDINNIIGGFQFFTTIRKKGIKRNYIDAICETLADKKINYYTCHYTKERTYNKLRKIMGEKIVYLNEGTSVDL